MTAAQHPHRRNLRTPASTRRTFAPLALLATAALIVGCSPPRPGVAPERSAQQDADVFARMINASWELADRSSPTAFSETMEFLLGNHADEPYQLQWDREEAIVTLTKAGETVCIDATPPASVADEMAATIIDCP